MDAEAMAFQLQGGAAMSSTFQWRGPEGSLGLWLAEFSRNTLESYRVKPELVKEHDNLERSTVESGYGRKQLNELAQNAADAMEGTTGRVSFVLTEETLYCANEGAPLAKSGLEALLMSHSSQKRDDKIGRFGLGFKSVLQLTDAPEIVSRSVSVRWDRSRAASVISEIVPGRQRYPVLRVAEPFNPLSAAEDDEVLRELMAWATTVVRLPLAQATPWLDEELNRFPREFMLFASQIDSLDFDNRRTSERQSWRTQRSPYSHGRGERVVLRTDTQEEAWDVFRLPHLPSATAIKEAGSIAARSELEVAWAVPLKNRARGVGKIWNYFPTQSYTTLSGVINATFKLNEDRQNMLAGLYNEEILTKTLPKIVAFALPDLVDPQDPGSILDILPARGREARSWGDEVLNEPVMSMVAGMRFLPDRAGTPHAPSDLSIEPDVEDADRIRAIWDEAVAQERPWAHRSLTSTRDRNATLNRLLRMAKKERATVSRWLEEVVRSGTNESHAAALRIAVEINQRHSELQTEMRSAHIIPAGNGSLQRPVSTAIFVPIDGDDGASNLVSLDFANFENVRELLRKLDIGPLNAEGQLKKVMAAVAVDAEDETSLEALWRLSRSVPLPTMLALLDNGLGKLAPVRCESGAWRPVNQVWLRGALFSTGSVEDRALVIDSNFHEQDLRVLHALGALKDLPEAKRISSGPLYQLWKRAISEQIEAKFRETPTPVSTLHLTFSQPFATNGLERLVHASAQVRVRATERILRQRHYDVNVKISNQYVEDLKVVDPDVWWAREHGAVETALGTIDVAYAVASVEGIPDGFLPVPQVQGHIQQPDIQELLDLPADPEVFKWPYVYALANKKLELPQLHQLYGIAAARGYRKPQQVSVMTKYGRSDAPLSEAHLAVNKRTYDYFVENRDAAILWVENEELRHALENRWGLKPIEIAFQSTLKFEPSGDELTLMKRIPFIHEGVRGISKVATVPCSALYMEHTNDAGDPPRMSQRDSYLQEDRFYYKSELPQRVWLQELLDASGRKLSAQMVLASAGAAKKRFEQDKKLKEVLAKQTDEEKLLALVGEQTIRHLIPDHVFQLVDSRRQDEELSGTALVQLASTLHGASLLQKIQPYLQDLGIETPIQFKGSAAAKDFVKKIGISEDFAGTTESRKPAREEAVGPVRLSPMHDYQTDVSNQIRAVLTGVARNRAIVQLPTGAGKTRVAVQSLVEHVTTIPRHSCVVWIAQTEELCEQAVDAWLYVWQGVGVPGERMAVSRLWDGRRPKPEETRLHVVVATIQTLSSLIESELGDFPWLFDADILVVDEAHGAIARSYTEVFKAFGRGLSDRGKPMIGLSATPYRGVNQEETERLVKRFDGQLLMPSQFSTENAHTYLQNMGVLANVRHETLEGIELQLTKGVARPDGSDSSMLETRIDLDAVARSQSRNDVILDHVRRVAEKETVLVFAASVKHAEALAAALTAEGVRSAAISSKTNPADRRRQIEDFRNGKLRVLTNFDVLSQGFDAPKVGAVYVCRPTFTPNKYLQMIGRGLRGPKNGGSDEVLIVNVEDNIDHFGHQLAFNHFEYLWNLKP